MNESADKLVTNNFSWARGVAKMMRKKCRLPFELGDIESVAWESLWKSAQKFYGAPENFRRFAGVRITWAILDWARTEMVRKDPRSKGGPSERIPINQYVTADISRMSAVAVSPDQQLDARKHLQTVQSALTPRQQKVIFELAHGWTLREIGTNLHVTESAVCLIAGKARKLLQPLESECLNP